MAEFKEVLRKREENCKFYADSLESQLCNFICYSFFDLKPVAEEFEEKNMNWEKPVD